MRNLNQQGKLLSIIIAIVAAFVIGDASAGTLAVTNSWNSGDTLNAADLNKNFTDTQSAVNDNDSRISALETQTHVISLSAQALSVAPGGTIITLDGLGLLWQSNYASSAIFTLRKPSDYSGGNVIMSIFFQTTTATAGVVDFFIRPRSFNSGDGYADIASISSGGTSVSGTSGAGTLYQQDFTIPAARFANNWWLVSIQRQGSNETYVDNVRVLSVSLQY